MQGRLRWYIVLFVAVALAALGLFWYSGQAHAQAPGGYDCDVNILAGGAFDAHCEPEATQTITAPTATGTATAQPTRTATQTPRPTSTTTLTPAAQTGAPRFAVMGDSFVDEYRADNARGGSYAATTLNMVEIVQRVRGFNFGPWGAWGGTRRTGYENNCALSGATSYSMVSGGQPQCVAAIVAAGKADYVLVAIGANDFSPSFGDTYQRIYSGAMGDAELNAKIARAVQDVTTGVDAALGADARGVLVVSFTQWGLDPSVAARFPNAAGRQRVDDAIGRVNAGLAAMAAERAGVVIIDQNAIGRDLILPKLDSAGNFMVGGEKISFLSNGDEPHHAKLADGSHLGTVMGAYMANWYFVQPLNEAFGFDIAPLTEAEMLSVAGIRPAGGTATWTPTPTASASATPTPTAPTGATPSTPSPGTPTPAPGSTGPAPPTAAPSPSALRINVPLTAATAGAPELDANNWSIIWAGDISPNGGYTQARLVGMAEGVRVYVQQMTPTLAGGAFTLAANGRTYSATPSSGAGWTVANRCGSPTSCRGWTATRLIPWAELGGRPAEGDTWPLALTVAGGEWRGTLHWGLPDYAGRNVPGAQTVAVLVSADASIGGGTDCGDDDIASGYFATWGSRNTGNYGAGVTSLGTIPYANVQAQWDVADWPCYARYAAKWPVSLPAGAQVVSATLELYKFGHSGYAGEATGTNVMQVWEASPDWTEDGISWDNSPAIWENVSRLPIGECAAAGCRPGETHAFDVTEIMRRAVARGDSEAAALLYTAAGQYHSGRYFYTREGSVKPVVRIAYTLGEEEPTWTPTATLPAATATSTSTPTATSLPPTAQPTTTATSTPTASSSTPTPTQEASATCTRYASPGGLAAAVAALKAGDTLCLRDGTYAEPFVARTNGTAAAPITVRALNDGKAIIDGQGVRKTVDLQRDWWVIEGVVARNGTDNVFRVDGSNNVLRRVSAYDASDDINSSVIMVLGDNNLVEDAIAAGTGRYMAEIFMGDGNTFRRVFSMWEGWAGRTFCSVLWPNGVSIGIYNGSNNTIESSLAYGRNVKQIMVQANADTAIADNNAVLGSIAVLAGRDYDGSIWTYGTGQQQPTSRPGPTSCTGILKWSDGTQRYGGGIWGQGQIRQTVIRDFLATGNVGVGLSIHRPFGVGATGTILDHISLYGNGAQLPAWEAAQGRNLYSFTSDLTITDSDIEGLAGVQRGEGARLDMRYENRQRTNVPVLPWPMESRGQAELGISIGGIWGKYATEAAIR